LIPFIFPDIKLNFFEFSDVDHELSSSGLDVPAGQHQRGESPSQQVSNHRTHE
jgi:hypothetical protein